MADMSAFPRFVYSCLIKGLVELTAITFFVEFSELLPLCVTLFYLKSAVFARDAV